MAPAMADPYSLDFSLFSRDVFKFYDDRSCRGGCALESMRFIFYFAFWMEEESILSILPSFYVRFFFSLC